MRESKAKTQANFTPIESDSQNGLPDSSQVPTRRNVVVKTMGVGNIACKCRDRAVPAMGSR